jgi:hypothetical protein
MNINGKYHINAGGIYELYEQRIDSIQKIRTFSNSKEASKDPYSNEAPHYVAQVMAYIKDAKKLVLCRVHSDGKMSLVSIIGFPKEN